MAGVHQGNFHHLFSSAGPFDPSKMPCAGIQHSSVVTVIEDPAGRTCPLLPCWRIIDRLEVGHWVENKAVACSSTVLHEGDFVDVGISFDIFILPLCLRVHGYEPHGKQLVRAHMKVEHVLQLCPTDQASEVLLIF